MDTRHEAIAVCAALLQSIEVAGVRHDHHGIASGAHAAEHVAEDGRLQLLAGEHLACGKKVVSYRRRRTPHC